MADSMDVIRIKLAQEALIKSLEYLARDNGHTYREAHKLLLEAESEIKQAKREILPYACHCCK